VFLEAIALLASTSFAFCAWLPSERLAWQQLEPHTLGVLLCENAVVCVYAVCVCAVSGDWVLVHAAAGGTGQLLVQICSRLLGARVIGTTSTAEKAEVARGCGAQEVGGVICQLSQRLAHCSTRCNCSCVSCVIQLTSAQLSCPWPASLLLLIDC
jgi:D-arabinose 1-dehydrogenase-like Zn-dependent alcohol dehydrogenase